MRYLLPGILAVLSVISVGAYASQADGPIIVEMVAEGVEEEYEVSLQREEELGLRGARIAGEKAGLQVYMDLVSEAYKENPQQEREDLRTYLEALKTQRVGADSHWQGKHQQAWKAYYETYQQVQTEEATMEDVESAKAYYESVYHKWRARIDGIDRTCVFIRKRLDEPFDNIEAYYIAGRDMRELAAETMIDQDPFDVR